MKNWGIYDKLGDYDSCWEWISFDRPESLFIPWMLNLHRCIPVQDSAIWNARERQKIWFFRRTYSKWTNRNSTTHNPTFPLCSWEIHSLSSPPFYARVTNCMCLVNLPPNSWSRPGRSSSIPDKSSRMCAGQPPHARAEQCARLFGSKESRVMSQGDSSQDELASVVVSSSKGWYPSNIFSRVDIYGKCDGTFWYRTLYVNFIGLLWSVCCDTFSRRWIQVTQFRTKWYRFGLFSLESFFAMLLIAGDFICNFNI